jgi:chemotaxis protein CheD
MAHTLYAGIGEMHVSGRPEETLAAIGLGSCVAIILYDPQTGLAGMAHCLLPAERPGKPSTSDKPALYVQTGLPTLIQAMLRAGASKAALCAVLVGGAAMFDFGGRSLLDVGSDNVAAARAALQSHGIPLVASDLGGNQGRSVNLCIGDPCVMVRMDAKERRLISLARLSAERAA